MRKLDRIPFACGYILVSVTRGGEIYWPKGMEKGLGSHLLRKRLNLKGKPTGEGTYGFEQESSGRGSSISSCNCDVKGGGQTISRRSSLGESDEESLRGTSGGSDRGQDAVRTELPVLPRKSAAGHGQHSVAGGWQTARNYCGRGVLVHHQRKHG